MELVLATENKHKMREFRDMLKAYPWIEILSLHHFPDYIPPPETGVTFKENALLKAVDAAEKLNRWVLADDSGLVVPALGGEPGVYSRRYAGLKATDLENCKLLLDRMAGLKDHQRTAYYECCLVLAGPHGMQKCAEATCEGSITLHPQGRNGFGYDPLFKKSEYDKTFGELDEGTKNRISHRRKAFERLLIYIENLKR